MQLYFQRVEGVVKTEVGYSNGKFSPVTYEAVCAGHTGHVEVVKVWYRPAVVSADKLLKLWDERHDVESMNKQGNDVGRSYASAVYWDDDEGKTAGLKWKEDALSRGIKVASELDEAKEYTTAEDYHQRYLEKKGQDASVGSKKHIRCYG